LSSLGAQVRVHMGWAYRPGVVSHHSAEI
jgi:hypothetical protein